MGDADDARVLAVEHRKCRSRAESIVHDVVHQTAGEDEHLPLPQGLLEQLALGVEEAGHHAATMNEHHLRCPWVRVGENHSAGGDVGARHRQPQGVQPRELSGGDQVHR